MTRDYFLRKWRHLAGDGYKPLEREALDRDLSVDVDALLTAERQACMMAVCTCSKGRGEIHTTTCTATQISEARSR